MGYRIGNQCFYDYKSANDFVLSQSLPSFTATGEVIRPVIQNDNWVLNGQVIKLSFPECDPLIDYQNGLKYSALMLSLYVTAFILLCFIRFIRNYDSSS